MKFLKQKVIPFVAVGKIPDDDVVQVDHDNVGARQLVTVLFAKGSRTLPIWEAIWTRWSTAAGIRGI